MSNENQTGNETKKKGRAKVDPNETSLGKFMRLSKKRHVMLMKQFELLQNLGASSYEVDPEAGERMILEAELELKRWRKKWKLEKGGDGNTGAVSESLTQDKDE